MKTKRFLNLAAALALAALLPHGTASAQGGWQNLRARQLYHDREEVTLSAWR